MLPPDQLRQLFDGHGDALRQLARVQNQLGARFAHMDGAIEALILAVAAGESLLLIGAPGTAKSRVIRAFCEHVGLLTPGTHNPRAEGYFEYLLTPFTEPSELFGFYDLPLLFRTRTPELKRVTQGMIQEAKVVFLDEVFNASSAILNSLLSFMNERRFHDRGQVVDVRLECLFGATNQVPESAELRALFDRFLLRHRVDNLDVRGAERDAFPKLLRMGASETWGDPQGRLGETTYPDLLSRSAQLRAAVGAALSLQQEFGTNQVRRLEHQVGVLRSHGLSDVSNRRLIKFLPVMVIHRLLRAARDDDARFDDGVGAKDRMVLAKYGVDRFDPGVMDKMSGWELEF